MARIARPNRADLSAGAQQVWDRIAGKSGDVRGPYAVLMNTPDLAGKVADLGALLRFDGHLPGKVRELAILATARTLGAAFEWVMHEPIARKEGISPETIELVRALGPIYAEPEGTPHSRAGAFFMRLPRHPGRYVRTSKRGIGEGISSGTGHPRRFL